MLTIKWAATDEFIVGLVFLVDFAAFEWVVGGDDIEIFFHVLNSEVIFIICKS